MAQNHDRFQMLKARYLNQVREREQELAELRAKLKLIQELEVESESLSPEDTDTGYSELGLTQAVGVALKVLGLGGSVSGGEVAKYLLSRGFKPQGKNFRISVGTTLKRLAARGKIIGELKAGKRLYKPIEEDLGRGG